MIKHKDSTLVCVGLNPDFTTSFMTLGKSHNIPVSQENGDNGI